MFLPATLAGYHGLRVYGKRNAAKIFLVLASLFFYGWWDIRYVPLVAISVLANFATGLLMERRELARPALIIGIVVNICLLGYYKYANFFLANLGELTGIPLTIGSIVLPLGISFFTFQQIGYLVETSRDGRAERNFLNYSLFAIFFPHLIAGPITHLHWNVTYNEWCRCHCCC
jgi:alginate O-acetyltransferase complex protein AlgI